MNEKTKLISVGDLFRESWSLYRERIRILTKIILLPVAFLVAGDLLGLFAPSGLADLTAFIGTVISFFAYLALIFALQENIQFGEAYRRAWEKNWPYIWLIVLSGFVILGGLVMFIIPGFIFLTWFIFYLYVFALEGERGMNALLRSREYIRGYWWQAFGRYVALVLSATVVVLALGFLGTTLIRGSEEGANIMINLSTFVISPFITAYLYVLYQNFKLLKPEIVGQPASGPRGFFYVSAVLGIIGLILIVLALMFFAAWMLSETAF